jgi:hypothetical protein
MQEQNRFGRESAPPSVVLSSIEARTMQAQGVFGFDLTDWTVWVTLGVGVAAAALVIVIAVLVGRWRARHRSLNASREEDLPWDDLLELLRTRRRERTEAGLPPDDEMPAEDVLQQLLANLPSQLRRSTEIPPEELKFLAGGGAEQRASQRRWGNPTEVYLVPLLVLERMHGLVVNRSTGGLAILVDKEVPPGTTLTARPVEAPNSVPAAEIEVRYCRKVGKNFLLGCQFRGEVPWNVRVWFG